MTGDDICLENVKYPTNRVGTKTRLKGVLETGFYNFFCKQSFTHVSERMYYCAFLSKSALRSVEIRIMLRISSRSLFLMQS